VPPGKLHTLLSGPPLVELSLNDMASGGQPLSCEALMLATGGCAQAFAEAADIKSSNSVSFRINGQGFKVQLHRLYQRV
jgi:hypothetical protein